MVRATFAGFTTAYSALQANQKRLDITGQNLSNMNTPGYTRQALQTSSINYTNPVSHYINGSEVAVGFGVHMDKVTQIRDPYLDVQYRNQMNKSGYADSMQQALDRLSDVFDESHIKGIWSAIEDIKGTLLNMQDSAKVNDAIYEAEFRSKMQALTNLFNDASKQIDEAEKLEYTKLDGRGTNELGVVDRVNDIIKQIGTLNRQIKQNQIFGQQSLELMDERNVLLDELSSYIPIEVTYYKDLNYDGKRDDEAIYNLDNNGNIIGRREWPDDLRVEMVYQDKDGKTQKLTLVEGTIGSNDQNCGSISFTKPDGYLNTEGVLENPKDVSITFNGFTYDATGLPQPSGNVDFSMTYTPGTPGPPPTAASAEVGNHFAAGSSSIQSSLDMLWKDGATEGAGGAIGINDVRGYSYYRNELDNLAISFATVMNRLNAMGNGNHDPASTDFDLLTSKDGGPLSAKNIGISADWQSGKVHVGKDTGIEDDSDKNQTATVLNMYEALRATYPYSNIKDKDGNTLFGSGDPYEINLGNNSFADYMNHISTILANDSYTNTDALKTNITVLNGIQNSRDSISGVSLDEEASNMMMYMSAYNAASRLMTTLDEALNTLINSTGLVGR